MGLQTAARKGLSNDLLKCCALSCEPASLSAAPTDSRRMFASTSIEYITLGWTNSPVLPAQAVTELDALTIVRGDVRL